MNTSPTSKDTTDSDPPPKKRNKPSPPTEHRVFKKIPVVIVENHNDVLNFIYNCFTSRHLPLEGNILVHFDSHPDMVVPNDIDTSRMYTKDFLFDLSIENWIMPGCFVGHFSTVIWLKNSWCTQISRGRHEFLVGKMEDKIGVTLKEDYFISEGSYAIEEWLKDTKKVTLQVIDADRGELNDLAIDKGGSVILDIDLDFFSTADPFVDIYEKADCYSRLKRIFHYSDHQSAERTSVTRRKQLKYLGELFDHLQDHRHLEGFNNSNVPEDLLEQVKELTEALHNDYEEEEIDYNLIYNAGCTCDHGGLPHHLSTPEEMEKYLKNFEKVLQQLPAVPKVITLARSSEDGYCPKEQVDNVQEKVLDILKKVYVGQVSEHPIVALNGETNWDIMRL